MSQVVLVSGGKLGSVPHVERDSQLGYQHQHTIQGVGCARWQAVPPDPRRNLLATSEQLLQVTSMVFEQFRGLVGLNHERLVRRESPDVDNPLLQILGVLLASQ